ncbi:protease SohB [Phytohalomonas tamaricis]|uniref:protease SohB n=1 Tax=Phytohalomonas tamaricis TaxID=2081032 RepID=UPI000D0B8905|nr:protease SohB [Phytohalomonas tamaricis]
MSDWFYEYGLFLAQAVTIVVAIAIVIGLLAKLKSSGDSGNKAGKLSIRERNTHFRKHREQLEEARLDKGQQTKHAKARRKAEKAEQKTLKKKNVDENAARPVVWVLDFHGDIRASRTSLFSEEISALLLTAKQGDEVVVRLESGGGLVHAYGLAAAQLDRLREADIKLTVCVDKVAASGGYMMACCADRLLAAPFAVIGSIGVVAQVPNIHRLLKKNDVDVEVLTAGKHKRTLTVVGENTEEGKAKFLEDLQSTHDLFKTFVAQRRPGLDIDAVADGDIWYGTQAIDEKLIDEVNTSESYLQSKLEEARVLEVSLKPKRTFMDRMGKQAALTIEYSAERVIERIVRSRWEKH